MFILRSVKLDDLEDLFELSSKVVFINLPHDKDMIKKSIQSSIKAFNSPNSTLAKNYYLFVLEDTSKKKVIGVSMIHAQHGTEDEPHFYLKVGQEHHYSKTINTGFTHGTLKLGLEYDGPTEIGGLVLSPDYRGNLNKLGKQISFVRFLYIGLNPDRFKPVIHSELMPPFDANGKAPLWEAIGRKFMNMEYNEADVLSRNNKEFILSLFPSENIYMALLPIEARDAVGKVGKETLGVKKMLRSIGFKYIDEIDPFDGGPHYRCPLKDITLIKNMIKPKYTAKINGSTTNKSVLIKIDHDKNDFYAVKADIILNEDKTLFTIIDKDVDKSLFKDGISYSCIDF